MDMVSLHSEPNGLDPYLVSAVILEESKYDSKAVSRSGALGLMQIMPLTGGDIAKSINIGNFTSEMLFEPEINIKMGTWYLRWLSNMFDSQVKDYFAGMGISGRKLEYPDILRILILGAYNGGPTRIRNWIQEYGIDDIDLFVENIPLEEPRRYIKKVLDSYEMYKLLYSGNIQQNASIVRNR